jgi:predicted nucleotidyltransferase
MEKINPNNQELAAAEQKKKEIADHLRVKYHPKAILLHGSRSSGNERPHSDWDIFMFFDEMPEQKRDRTMIAGEDVEWKGFQLPVPDDQIIKTFDVYLQSAKVLWEDGNAGSELLERAKIEYEKGPQLNEKDLTEIKQFIEHKIGGMIDDIESPYMFFRHLSMVSSRITNLWFEALHNEFSKPFYLAMPTIKERDPECYELLVKLYDHQVSNEEKIEAAKQLKQKLFK